MGMVLLRRHTKEQTFSEFLQMVGTKKSPRNGLKIKEKDTKGLAKGKENDKRFDKGWQAQALFVNALRN